MVFSWISAASASSAWVSFFSIIAVLMRASAGEAGRQDPAMRRRELEAVLAFGAGGQLRPHVSGRFALEDFAAAMRMLQHRQAIGRVVLTIAAN